VLVLQVGVEEVTGASVWALVLLLMVVGCLVAVLKVWGDVSYS
jgi:hypothetical protein